MSTSNNATGLIAKGSPSLPLWFIIVRYVTLLFSIGVLATAAYHLSLFDGIDSDLVAKYSGPTGFLLFDAIWTILIIVFMVVCEHFLQSIYYRIVFLVCLCLAVIFWIAGWAWAASAASDYFSLVKDYYGEDVHGKSPYGDSLAAEAGLGAVCWVLTIVLLAFYIIFSLRSSEGTGAIPQAELGSMPQGEPKPPQQIVSQNQYPVSPQQQQQQQQFGYPQPYPTTQQYPQQQQQPEYQQGQYVQQQQQPEYQQGQHVQQQQQQVYQQYQQPQGAPVGGAHPQ